MPNFNVQLRAMLSKNIALHKRYKAGIICEYVFPLLIMGFVALFVYIFTVLFPITTKPYILHYPEGDPTTLRYSTAFLPCAFPMAKCYISMFPDTPEAHEIGDEFEREITNGTYSEIVGTFSNPPRFEYFSNISSLREYASEKSLTYVASIVFKDTENYSDYSIYMNGYYLPSEKADVSVYSSTFGFLSNASKFDTSGYTTMQMVLDQIIMRRSLKSLSNETFSDVNKNKSEIYEDDEDDYPFFIKLSLKLMPGLGETITSANFGSMIGFFVAVYSAISTIPLFAAFLINLVTEKTAKTREYLFMMGLKKPVYWLSWFITFIIPTLLYVVVALVLIYLVGAFEGNVVQLILVYLLYGLSLIFFSFFIQCFIDSVSIIASVFWIFIPLQVFGFLPTNKWVYMPFTIFAPMTFVFGVYKVSAPTIVNDPLIPQVTDVMGWGTIITMLVVDNIIYALLAWYFNEISPGEYGVPKSKTFFLDKSYWVSQKREHSQAQDYRDNENTDMFEPISSVNDKGVGVILSDLDKVFDKSGPSPVHAVAGVSAGFGRGGITALLGHNGAGKSTTISMLVGLITPTSGDAFIEGKSILSDIDEIRKSIGICPQMDLLFPTLSAKEHLELVGKLRTGSNNDLSEEIITTLANIGLPTNDQQAGTFSGGMKRKLSLAMALFWDPKVVFLDEPTTGIDTISKRQIWDALLMAKKDKTIILTTHSMEEADAISDYIYIMSEGKLKCGGTSMFLKRNFGIGYYLNVEKGLKFDTNSFLGFVQSHISGAIVLKDTPQTASFGIPFGFTKKFPEIFKEIDKRLEEFGIQSYGLSITTLEDVFIRMGSNTEVRGAIEGEGEEESIVDEKAEKANDHSFSSDSDKDTTELKQPLIEQYQERNKSTKERQAQVIAWMNAIFYLRRWGRSLAIILIPAILMLCFLIPSMLNNFEMPQAPDSDLHNTYLTPSSQRLTTNIVIPYAVVNSTAVNETDLTNFFDSVTKTAPTVSFVEYSSLDEIDDVVNEEGYYEVALGFNSLSSEARRISATLMYNATVSYSLPSIENLVANAFIRIIRDNATDPEITINSYSRGLSLFPTNAKSGAMSMFLVISILFGILISSGLSAQRLVSERECMFKSQMFLAGMDPVVYPVVNILMSILPLLVSSVISAVVATSFGVTGTRGFMFFPFILTLLLFSFAISSFNYVFSRMFNKADSCIKWIVILQVVIAIIPNMLVGLINAYPYTDPKTIKIVDGVTYVLEYVIEIFPTCAFFNSLSDIASVEYKSLSEAYAPKGIIFISTMFLIFDFIFYFILAVVIEVITNKAPLVPQSSPAQEGSTAGESQDVSAARVHAETQADRNDLVVVKNLRKEFGPNFAAVKNLSMPIRVNECFGLLGPNGAGKSTSINMITGELKPTCGSIEVNGIELSGPKSEFFQKSCIGRCLQIDALVDYLTPRDHIKILSMIRTDSSDEQIARDTAEAIRNIDLERYADREVGKLSGGNRRKLSVALAMLPGSRVIILDEPSTGMDPVTRRSLWNAIHREYSKEGRTVLLTTHSMEEAETVCSNIGIIAGGLLRCYGSVQHLKSVYSDGYHAIIELHNGADMQKCDEFIMSVCKNGQGRLIDATGRKRTYVIGKNVSLGELFERIENEKERIGIDTYMVTQTSLEDVFLTLIRG